MTRITVPPLFPNPIPRERFALNGDLPSSAAFRRVAWTYNNAAVNQRKMLFALSHFTQSTPAPATASEAIHYFMFRTGENVESIAIMTGLAPASQANGSNSGYVQLFLDHAGGTESSSKIYYPKVQAGTYLPKEVAWSGATITAAVAADTVYMCWLQQVNYARVHSMMVYEVANPIGDASVVGIADPLHWETVKPIYDTGIQGLAETGTELWKHNAAQLISWSRHSIASMPTITSTSYVNLLATGASTVTAATPGFRINTEFHDSQKGDVPVEVGVFAVRTAGSGTASVKFVDASGTLFEETGITSGTRFTATGTMVAKAAEKTDIHVKVNTGGATWEFYTVGLWEYEA